MIVEKLPKEEKEARGFKRMLLKGLMVDIVFEIKKKNEKCDVSARATKQQTKGTQIECICMETYL